MTAPRGRPRREIPPALAEAFENSSADEPATLDVTGHPSAEVDEVRTVLRAAARHAGCRVRFRTVGGTLYFWQEAK